VIFLNLKIQKKTKRKMSRKNEPKLNWKEAVSAFRKIRKEKFESRYGPIACLPTKAKVVNESLKETRRRLLELQSQMNELQKKEDELQLQLNDKLAEKATYTTDPCLRDALWYEFLEKTVIPRMEESKKPFIIQTPLQPTITTQFRCVDEGIEVSGKSWAVFAKKFTTLNTSQVQQPFQVNTSEAQLIKGKGLQLQDGTIIEDIVVYSPFTDEIKFDDDKEVPSATYYIGVNLPPVKK
jgi:hypothetical protein